MKQTLNWLLSITVVILLTSCITIGEKFELAPVSELQIGKTTMAEARSLFGNPVAEFNTPLREADFMVFGKDKYEKMWRYIYTSTAGGTKSKELLLYFDKKGILSDYYYSSDYKEDNIEKVNENFDIFLVKDKVIPGKTNKALVKVLLGEIHKEVDINKPGVTERWSYQFVTTSKEETVTYGTITIPKPYVKSAHIDFNSSGIVVHAQGESTFPEDKEKFFTESK